MAVKEVDDSQFQDELQNSSKAVVKFYAGWCGSCKLFAPKFKRMSESEEYQEVDFMKVNAEENPEARKWAGVSNLPFFAVVKDGEVIASDNTTKEEAVKELINQVN